MKRETILKVIKFKYFSNFVHNGCYQFNKLFQAFSPRAFVLIASLPIILSKINVNFTVTDRRII